MVEGPSSGDESADCMIMAKMDLGFRVFESMYGHVLYLPVSVEC